MMFFKAASPRREHNEIVKGFLYPGVFFPPLFRDDNDSHTDATDLKTSVCVSSTPGMETFALIQFTIEHNGKPRVLKPEKAYIKLITQRTRHFEEKGGPLPPPLDLPLLRVYITFAGQTSS